MGFVFSTSSFLINAFHFISIFILACEGLQEFEPFLLLDRFDLLEILNVLEPSFC